jgi:LDH2 family malate/lactate/ureidoglycolate dehydrogenase
MRQVAAEETMVVGYRYAADALKDVATRLLVRAGLAAEKASVVASVFVEADLLGYATHGLQRLASNLEWIVKGETHANGALTVLTDNGSCQTWDADFLPGPWVTTLAVKEACTRAQTHGIATISIRRAQHIACLAAYLEQATEQGMMLILSASTPSETAVCAHGGLDRIFSCNPLTIGIPTSGTPILIDTSASMSALGPLFRAHRSGDMLPTDCIITSEGSVSRDPAEFVLQDGAILPTGGFDQGYKGFGLCLFIEALSAALTGYGRADLPNDGESNSVFVQVIDPAAFAGREAFFKQVDWLAGACRQSRVLRGAPLVRVPGDRALAMKRDQIANGIALHLSIIEVLHTWTERFGVPMPEALAHDA